MGGGGGMGGRGMMGGRRVVRSWGVGGRGMMGGGGVMDRGVAIDMGGLLTIYWRSCWAIAILVRGWMMGIGGGGWPIGGGLMVGSG